jgi:hypothetical protein
MVGMDRDETVSSRFSTGSTVNTPGWLRHLPFITGAISGPEPEIHQGSVWDAFTTQFALSEKHHGTPRFTG